MSVFIVILTIIKEALLSGKVPGLGHGIFPHLEFSPSCLPSKKIKRLIIVYPRFVPDWGNATLFDPRY